MLESTFDGVLKTELVEISDSVDDTVLLSTGDGRLTVVVGLVISVVAIPEISVLN